MKNIGTDAKTEAFTMYKSQFPLKQNFKQNVQRKLQYDSIQKDSRRISGSISMTDLFKENIENRDRVENIYSKLACSVKSQDLQMLQNQHRIEVQKLLLEISRLHDVIYEIERTKKHELQKLKQDYEHMIYLQLNNIRQAQTSQTQILEYQLKKTQSSLIEKSENYENLLKSANKEKEMFQNQIETLRNDLKQLISKKNDELFVIREENEENVKNMKRKNEYEIQEMKDNYIKEIRRIQKMLKEKQEQVEKMEKNSEDKELRMQEIKKDVEKEKEELENKFQQYIESNSEKYEKLKRDLNDNLLKETDGYEARENLQRDLFTAQIRNLLEIIEMKNEQILKMKAYLQTLSLEHQLLRSDEEEGNQYLKNVLKTNQQKHLQEIEQLKIKMAILHENDIKQLVKLYETKINGLNDEISRLEEQNQRKKKYMHEQCHRWYQWKKNTENKISKLQVEILRLKSGMGNLEKEMTEKMESERSALLLTSQNLIKDVEQKNANSKFYEDQLRKIRKILDNREKEIERLQNIIKQQQPSFEEQIKKYKNLLRNIQEQSSAVESEYKLAIEDKDQQIKRLNRITHELSGQRQQQEESLIGQLRDENRELMGKMEEKNKKIENLLIKVERMEKQLQESKIENEHLILENQINHSQSKAEYDKASQESTKTMKNFYERRIADLEDDRLTLQNKLSAENENMIELVRKYRALEGGMQEMVGQSKRRSKLQRQIISMGMDNNLVKNKAELFSKGYDQ